MNPHLPPLLGKDKIDALCNSLRRKLENTDDLTRVTNRDVEMYESNFKARVPRDMAGRVDYLDDSKATLGQRREMMRSIHHTIQHGKDFEEMLSINLLKKTLASAKCWAVLLTMEWDELVAFHHVLRTGDAKTKKNTLRAFLMACSSVSGLIWWMSKTPRSPKEQIWVRNEAQRNAALARDDFRCVLTHSGIKEECHVCPFWSLSRREEIQFNVIIPLTAILGEELSGKLMRILDQETAPGDFDLLDSPANMITLSNQLHKMWDDGVFGLEPIRCRKEYFTVQEAVAQEKPGTGPSAMKRGAEAAEHQPSHKRAATKGDEKGKQIKFVDKERLMYGIELRFHWLQKTKLGGLGDSPSTPDADPRDMWKDWDHDNVRDNRHATPLENGHIFTIWSEDHNKVPNWELVSIQWLAFRLHRLSGAANVDLYAPQRDQDDDEALAARVIQAKREATEMVAERLGLDPDELWADPRGPYYVPTQIPQSHAD